MYLDSAYIAKFYVNERDAPAVRRLIRRADVLNSSLWALAEVSCVFHRHMREGALSQVQFREMLDTFLSHVDSGVWTLAAIGERVLRRTSLLVRSVPAGVYLRAGDAVHLATAQELGEREIWTSDRHLLAAAPHAGLAARTADERR